MPQVLYNSLNRRFLELNQVQAAIYGGLAVPITRNLMNLREPAVEQLLEALVSRGFFVSEETDEVLQQEVRSSGHRFDARRLSFWVQATTRCEEGCPECPYRDSRNDLEEGAAELLEGIVSGQAGVLRELEVAWFGGEPTLNWDSVSGLNRRFAALALKCGFSYRWDLFSSGRHHHLKTVLIDPDSPRRLFLNLGSLDSTEFDGQSTTVLANFQTWQGKAKSLPPRSRIRFSRNRPSSQLCRSLNGFCRRAPAFTDDEYEVMRSLLESGHRLDNLPSTSVLPCPAVDARSFIMDVRGNLYKCWNGFGQPQKGVPSTDDRQHPNFIRWLNWGAFRTYHCRNCNILPWCLGGCLDSPPDEDCGQWRFSLREMLRLQALADEKGAA